jgi:hypothetical protein
MAFSYWNGPDGAFVLRTDWGGECVIVESSDHSVWIRRTHNGYPRGTRYAHYLTRDQALAAGIEWAKRNHRRRLTPT